MAFGTLSLDVDLEDLSPHLLQQILSHQQLTKNAPADVVLAIDAGVAMGLFEVSDGPVLSTEDSLQKNPSSPYRSISLC
jgi:hypothetical protein